MKIILLHGDNTIKSRERLHKFILAAKKRNWEVERINKDQELNLAETLTSESLFKKNRLFIVEDVLKIKPSHIKWLKENKNKLEGNLVIYNDKLISKGHFSKLPEIDKIEEYKLPRLVFKFLESFYPGNSKTSIYIFHQVIETEPPVFIFALLTRFLKDIYKASVDIKSINYPTWRKSKLISQAKKFKEEQIIEILNKMSEIDVLSKTTDNELTDLLDLLILTQLE